MESPESSETTAMESEISNVPEISIQPEVSNIPESSETNFLTSMNSSINELSVNDERMAGSHRAKAFILNTDTNDWEEIATGICSPEPSEDGEVFAIRLRAEEDSSLVLHTAYFHKGQEIGVQNETVLTWTNLDGDEAALSFESSIGCEEFWKLICRFYGKSFEEWKLKQSEEGGNKNDEEDGEEERRESEEFEQVETMKNEGFYDEYFEDSQVPKIEIAFPEKPEISTLTEIEEGLYQSLMIPSLRRQISEILIQYRYIPCLLEIFQHCEEFGMLQELGKLYRIFKSFFLLNGQELLKELMSEDNYLLVAGVMEYDGVESKMNLYRTFLSDDSKFKQVIPLNNENILQLIHQTFRLLYFKDVILAKILDEESSASIIILIRLNHMAIINAIDNDPEVLEVIRKLLQTVNMPLNDQINVLKFFKEFLTIAKTVTLRKSLQIHQTVVVNDFMKFITRVLNNKESDLVGEDEDSDNRHDSSHDSPHDNLNDNRHDNRIMIKESKLLAIGLFTNFIQHDPSQIRNYLIQNDLRHEQRNLLNTVIDMFTDVKTCSPVRWQLVSALKILLDTFNPTIGVSGVIGGNPQILNQALAQKSGEDFLNYFYPEYASRLLRPLIDFDKIVFNLTSENDFFFKENLSKENCEILFHLGELLCNFINQHKYRIKYLVLRNLILQNGLLLFKCREKHLQLTGLRIFRATLAVEDEFYFRFFIQHRSFSSLFALYKASGGADCDNLVTSAILELFEFIRIPRDSLKALVRHLSTVYKPELESFGPTCVFRGILETEDRIDRESSVVSFASSQSQTSNNQSDQEMSPRGGANEDEAEEDYFSNIEEVEDIKPSEDFNDYDITNDFVPASKPASIDDDEDDHFELLLKKNLPGSPTKKTKI